jgi:LCP family protein required for cell wall assembly
MPGPRGGAPVASPTVFPADPPAARRRRRRRNPLPLTIALATVIGVAGTTGVLRAADQRTDKIERVEGMEAVLAANDGPAENYLLVGSDSRENSDPSSPDFGGIGDAEQVGGRRSDTIMVLRREKDGGAALLSLPRDLWVDIAGTGQKNRINSAYNDGPERLAATITQSLGIPINHYVEVDFEGFKDIVDAIGGVVICVDYATRDDHTGLNLQPGCSRLDGVQALAYARSRYYEEFRDGDWRTDPTADLGRMARQQAFIRAAVDGVLADMQDSPFGTGDLIEAVAGSVRIDASVDPMQAANALQGAAQQGLATFTLPVQAADIDGNAVLLPSPEAEAVLAYFRGQGPQPAVPTTAPS